MFWIILLWFQQKETGPLQNIIKRMKKFFIFTAGVRFASGIFFFVQNEMIYKKLFWASTWSNCLQKSHICSIKFYCEPIVFFFLLIGKIKGILKCPFLQSSKSISFQMVFSEFKWYVQKLLWTLVLVFCAVYIQFCIINSSWNLKLKPAG